MGNSCNGSNLPKITNPDGYSGLGPLPSWLKSYYGAASLSALEFPPLTNQQKLERLKTLKLFILDNSVRESTVAQNRGHTFEDKFKILDNVKSCKGITHQLIANFVTRPRVDDLFIKEFHSKPHPEYEGQTYYCFSELFDTVIDGVPSNAIPVGCQRAAEYGMKHIMLEFDLMNPITNWEATSMDYFCNLFRLRFDWIRQNVNKNANIFVNCRDFSVCWDNEPRRIASVIHYLSNLPKEVRVFGFCFEDPLADVLPIACCEQARRTRAIMNNGGWTDAHLLCHIHNGYGLGEATVLDFLIGGGDGIWCSISRVGAASGHANSLTTVYNLHRLGNEYVQNTYSLPAMRKAAIEITRITTGKDPDQRTELYGSRAIDIWCEGIMPGDARAGKNMAVMPRTRLSVIATPSMVRYALIEYFGERDGTPPLLRNNVHKKSPKGRSVEIRPYIKEWDMNICQRMLNTMHLDLKANRKEDVNTAVGICSLYERSGGIPDNAMLEVIAADEEVNNQAVMKELREYYDSMLLVRSDLEVSESMKVERLQTEPGLTYRQFFDAFLKEELPSFESAQTREVLEILDFDRNEYIDWAEIVYRVKWVLQEYPDECTSIKNTIHCLYENYIELEVDHHKRQQLAQKRISKVRLIAQQIIQELPKHKDSIENVKSGEKSQEDLTKELLEAIPGIPMSRESSVQYPPPPTPVVPTLMRPQSGHRLPATFSKHRIPSARFIPPTALERKQSISFKNKLIGNTSNPDLELNLNLILESENESRNRNSSVSYYVAPDGRRHASSIYNIREVLDDTDEPEEIKKVMSKSNSGGHQVFSVVEEDSDWESESDDGKPKVYEVNPLKKTLPAGM